MNFCLCLESITSIKKTYKPAKGSLSSSQLFVTSLHFYSKLNSEDLNTELRKNANNESDKDFFKLMNNLVFGKTMENVRNHRDIKLVRTNKRRNQLVSEPNYNSTKYFSKGLVAIEMNKTSVKMNKPIS